MAQQAKDIPLEVEIEVVTEDGERLTRRSEHSRWEVPPALQSKATLPVRCTITSVPGGGRPLALDFAPPREDPPDARSFDFDLPLDLPEGRQVLVSCRLTAAPDEVVENVATSDQGVSYKGGHRKYNMAKWR